MNLAEYVPTDDEFSCLIGKSTRWVRELRAQGHLPASGSTLKAMNEAWVKRETGSFVSDRQLADLRLTTAKAEQEEIKSRIMSAELLQAHLVTDAVQSAFANVRARLLAIPSRAAPSVYGMTSMAAVMARLSELIDEALVELAETAVIDVSATSGSIEATGEGGEELVADAEAAAEDDSQRVGRSEPVSERRRQRRAGKVEHGKS